ncbi:MAG TPA: hypothetical protein PLW68_15915 [Casimicrobiaceae bacterium]|nr:hypothetical protein [Casimicrobiaceae bacterium]
MDRLPLALQLALLELVKLAAPVVCLFYRGGWFNTPDDPASPHGMYEPAMRDRHARWGTRWADWWWLGVRNRAYGLAYAMKPRHFKRLESYRDCQCTREWRGRTRITTVDGWTERAIRLGPLHLLAGYRVTPIYNEASENLNRREEGREPIPFRPINMDARPILSLRAGAPD